MIKVIVGKKNYVLITIKKNKTEQVIIVIINNSNNKQTKSNRKIYMEYKLYFCVKI